MIERIYTLPDFAGIVPTKHNRPTISSTTPFVIEWRDADDRLFLGAPGDNPDDPETPYVVWNYDDGTRAVVLYGRSARDPDGAIERHVITLGSRNG